MTASIHIAHTQTQENAMSWSTPKVVEIAVGMEINAYACADLTD